RALNRVVSVRSLTGGLRFCDSFPPSAVAQRAGVGGEEAVVGGGVAAGAPGHEAITASYVALASRASPSAVCRSKPSGLRWRPRARSSVLHGGFIPGTFGWRPISQPAATAFTSMTW